MLRAADGVVRTLGYQEGAVIATGSTHGPSGKVGRLLRLMWSAVAYGVGMAMLAIVAMVMIPWMVRSSGASAWSALASGQAIGAISATFTGYGWGLTGPASVATSPPSAWRRLYVDSLRVKLAVILPAVAAASAVAHGLNTEYGSYAVAGCIAASLVGLSSEWFFVGLNRPWTVLALETVPRVLGGAGGILLMGMGKVDARGALACQSLGLIMGMVVAWVAILKRIAPSEQSDSTEKAPLRSLFIAHKDGVASQVIATGYNAAPISIVAMVAAPALPIFAVLDKAQKQIVTVIQPAATALQGFTPSARRRQLAANAVYALLLGCALSVALLVLLIFVGPAFLEWLSVGQIPFEPIHIRLLALNCAVALLDSFLGRGVLPALDRVDAVVRATSFCSVGGIVAVFVLTPPFGAVGALVGFGLGIGSRCLWQAAVVMHEVRAIRRDPEGSQAEVSGSVASKSDQATRVLRHESEAKTRIQSSMTDSQE